jgi:5'-nucleotidase (lipoprotein e(P4) family)
MKKVFYILLATFATLFISFSAGAFNKSVMTQQELNTQSVLGINWVQQSGEYRALAYQAFNIARIAFDNAISNNIDNPTVIVDLDETVLDNSPYQASLINTNNSFNSQTWNQWVKDQKALAIPGAVDFVNYVNNNGGKVFFVSNRGKSSTNKVNDYDLEIATMNNMIKLGFSGVNEETLLLKGEFIHKIDNKIDTSKKWRMDAVTNGRVDGIKHNSVVFIGDNLNDFEQVNTDSNEIRKSFVDKTKQQQGIFTFTAKGFKPAYISLPNPMYGDWENGLYDASEFSKKNFWDLTPAQKSIQRFRSLIRRNK